MSPDELSYRRFPRVPIERRVGAFLIDFITVWFVSSFFPNAIQWLIFLLGWLGMRVLLVDKNQGQSLGRWAFDFKIIDARFYKVPDLVSLTKREGVLGFAAMLAMYGLEINLRNGLSMLLLISPLSIDCGIAIADEQLDQAFHDRLAETIAVQTERGYSLDLRIKKLLAQIKRNMRKY
jgi:uncharacterized RDD family membrane protein YckC